MFRLRRCGLSLTNTDASAKKDVACFSSCVKSRASNNTANWTDYSRSELFHVDSATTVVRMVDLTTSSSTGFGARSSTSDTSSPNKANEFIRYSHPLVANNNGVCSNRRVVMCSRGTEMTMNLTNLICLIIIHSVQNGFPT